MSATERFNAAVEQRMQKTGEPRHVAHRAICYAEPELRKAMVAEANANRAERIARR